MRVSVLELTAWVLASTTFGYLAGCGDSGGSTFPTGGGGGSSGSQAVVDAGSSGDGAPPGTFFTGSGSGSGGSTGKSSGSQSGSLSSGSMVVMCAGCIDLNGACQPGTADTACGLGSSTCQPCANFNQSCVNGLCSGGGGGSGSSMGSGSGSGSSSGSGAPQDAGGGG